MFISVLGVVIFAAIWFWASRQDRNQREKWEKPIPITESILLDQQAHFESRIESGLPDRVRGKEVEIYKMLMRPWFEKLIAQHRYDEKMSAKLREDWSLYLEQLDNSGISSFLAMEAKTEQDRHERDAERLQQQRTCLRIEDAFAAQIGPEAVEKLMAARA